jgi:hypothetical protein
MQDAQYLEKRRKIILLVGLHHILFNVTLYTGANRKATYWSYLMTIGRSNVTR